MADTCRGLDASAPQPVLDLVRTSVKRKNKHIVGKDSLDAGDYCLLDLLDGQCCGKDKTGELLCAYGQPLVKVDKPSDDKKIP